MKRKLKQTLIIMLASAMLWGTASSAGAEKYITDFNTSAIGSATFSDGTTLTWDELQYDKNGKTYNYKADKLSDTDINTFNFCYNLTGITIPDSVTSIGEQAFEQSKNLKAINVAPDNPNYSSDENGVLFNKDKTVLLRFPINCEVTEYVVPDGVKSINDNAFKDCAKITGITFPDSVTSINYNAFCRCTELKEITIPGSATRIDNSAFEECESLTKVTISNGVESIGDWAFKDCDSLTEIIIPNSVTLIGTDAFEFCTRIKNVQYGGTEEDWGNIEIENGNDYLVKVAVEFNKESIPADTTDSTTSSDNSGKTDTVHGNSSDTAYDKYIDADDDNLNPDRGSASPVNPFISIIMEIIAFIKSIIFA